MRHSRIHGTIAAAAVVLSLSLIAAAAAWGETESTGEQLLITGVATDFEARQLTISGYGFCETPTVTLAERKIAASYDDGVIVAKLPARIRNGDFLLTVDCQRGNNGFDAWALTLGAVGPPGQRGPRGPRGAQGPAAGWGSPGPPPPSYYRRLVKFRCETTTEPSCQMTEEDRPVALCDPGDVATGGTAFGRYQGLTGLWTSQPYPVNKLDAPTGWTVPLRQRFSAGPTLHVIAVCVDLTP